MKNSTRPLLLKKVSQQDFQHLHLNSPKNHSLFLTITPSPLKSPLTLLPLNRYCPRTNASLAVSDTYIYLHHHHSYYHIVVHITNYLTKSFKNNRTLVFGVVLHVLSQHEPIHKLSLLKFPHILHEVLKRYLLLVEFRLQHMNRLLTSFYTRHLLQHHLGYLISWRYQVCKVSDLMLIAVVHKMHHLLTLLAQSWWLRLQRSLVSVQGLKSSQQRHVLFLDLGQFLLLSHH